MEFFNSHVSPDAVERLSSVLRSGRLSEGPIVAEFESELASRLGLRRPVAVNSGTSALHLALAVSGVGPGDEVIIPPQTFVATGTAVLMCGAVPVFADIDPATANLSPDSLLESVTPRTRAAIPVHWAGYPCDMDEINAVANRHGLAVIEDAAQALGAQYRGRPVGSLSRFTAFSFQAIKQLTTGDGGLLCCLEEQDARTARRRRWFGIERADRPGELGERDQDIAELGFKYHMNDLAAAIGLANIEDLPRQIERRADLAARYRKGLGAVPGLQLIQSGSDRQSAHWLFPVLVERRLDLLRLLKEKGVPASVVHQRIDRFSLFGGVRQDLEGQARFDRMQLHLPLHSGLTDDDVDRVIAIVRSGW